LEIFCEKNKISLKLQMLEDLPPEQKFKKLDYILFGLMHLNQMQDTTKNISNFIPKVLSAHRFAPQ